MHGWRWLFSISRLVITPGEAVVCLGDGMLVSFCCSRFLAIDVVRASFLGRVQEAVLGSAEGIEVW